MSAKANTHCVCAFCGTSYRRAPSRIKRVATTFCSRPCVIAYRRVTPESFWARVDRSEGPDGCWPWLGSCDTHGYGQVTFDGHLTLTHRLAFFLTYGHWPMPIGRHTCDNPPCSNPRHVIEGDYQQNSEDMMSRGRHRPSLGSNHGNTELDERQVCEIRLRYARDGTLQRTLAEEYGLTQTTISKIIRRDSWKHVA